MARVMSATDARIHFGELLRRVAEHDETVIVERGGAPRVVVLSVAEYERLRAADSSTDRWWDAIQEARAAIAAELGGRRLPPSEDIIREMREERDAQLLHGLRRREHGDSTSR